MFKGNVRLSKEKKKQPNSHVVYGKRQNQTGGGGEN